MNDPLKAVPIPLYPLAKKIARDEKLISLIKLYGKHIIATNGDLPTEKDILDQLVFTVKDERLSFLLPGHNKYDILGKLVSNRSLFAEIHKKYRIVEIISIDFGTPQRLVLINGLKKEAFIPVISKEVIADYAVLEAKIKSHLPKEVTIETSTVRKPILTAKELAERYINNDKVVYEPSSESPAIGSVTPSNMATEVAKVLEGIEKTHGNIDRFVMLKLGYKNKEELYEAFAGEQVDCMAMAIIQMEANQGFVIGDSTGQGKGRAQPLDAQILTKGGFIKMGDVKIGDKIISADGGETTVVNIYPQGVVDVYRVQFKDGTSTEASGDHLWSTQTKQERHAAKNFSFMYPIYSIPKIRTTLEMAKRIGESVAIPCNRPVRFNYRKIPIDPYLLGVILGDACIREGGVELTCADDEILKSVERSLPKGVTAKKTRKYHYQLSGAQNSKPNPLTVACRQLGITGKTAQWKFIPDVYLRNSMEVRIAVLQGLIDTDGYVEPRGSCMYYTVSDELADDVQWLVRSLGGTTTRGVKKTNRLDCHVIYIKMPNEINPCRLSRKSNLIKDKLKYPPLKYVESITLIGQKECQCIEVDHPSHLYVTDDFIVTHNCAAGLIRYSIKQGKIPIFFTEKANLFSDLYRDLKDIGCGYYRPFIVNDKNGDNDPTIVDEYGFVVHKVPPAAIKVNAYKKGIVPHGFDFIMATYSQFTSAKTSEKKTWLAKISMDQPVYMDESHNVAGWSNSGIYFQALLRSVQSVCYFSATFAKRPDNMPVYASKTAMEEANMSQASLIEAIVKGGVAMQEIVSANLVECGQMVRRERDMTGVKNYFSVLEPKKADHWALADVITDIVRDILWFQKDHIDDIISDLADNYREEEKKVTYSPYSAKVFNIIDQMLFAIKAESVAEAAIKACKNNRKPVIAFKSTMEAFMKNSELVVGDFLASTSFELSLIKGLEGTLNYTIKEIDDEFAEKIKCRIEFDQLPPAAQLAYGEIMYKIANTSTSISISPIDIIKKRITDAGYKVGEITGRKMELSFNDDGSATVKAREERDLKKIVRSFNNGDDIDVVLLNASGASGLSLHASAKFKDQRQRMMITHQLEGDINKEIQKRGRIDRSGQVERGEYWYIVTSIPAESRLLMMFKEKLKSLDANTTSSQKTKDASKVLVDFLNKYGDQVIVEYLKENRDLNSELQDPLKFDDMGMDELNKLKTVENAAHKVTGRIAILPCADQERFYEAITQRYSDYIQYLNDTDTNDLEVRVLPLDAETIAQRPFMYGSGGKSPFGKDSTIEKCRVNILKKPLTKDELESHIAEALDGLLPAQKQKVLVDGLDKYYKQRVKQVEEYVKEKFMEKKKEASEKYTTPSMLKTAFKMIENLEHTDLVERKARLEQDKQYVRRVYINFMIGDEYDVPSVVTSDVVKTSRGIFLGYKSNHSTINPFAPSSLIMSFATLDGRRIVQVPLSITEWVNAALTARAARKLPEIPLRQEWGLVRTDNAKETRYIVTGNILQAYDNIGQLVAYTTVDGDLKKGILMPIDYRPEDFIMVPAMQALKEAKEMEHDDMLVSAGKEVTLARKRGAYAISVSASKTIGGPYYGDKVLLSLLASKFIQVKGKMESSFNEEYLDEMFLLFAEKFKLKFKVRIKTINNESN